MDEFSDTHHRLLAIDPGFNFGIAILELNFDNDECTVLHLHTFDTMKVAITVHPLILQVHGERVAKLKAIESIVERLMFAWGVSGVVSEAPYLGRFANSFQSLTECIMAIRWGVFKFSDHVPLMQHDPTTVKKGVGAPKSKDKGTVREAISKLEWVKFKSPEDFAMADEHAIDACAVGITHFLKLKEGVHENK
jgi:Holliday junction resolvasome RuvABC endonuclease subunit